MRKEGFEPSWVAPPDPKSRDGRPQTLKDLIEEFRSRYAALQTNPHGYDDNLRILERHLGTVPIEDLSIKMIQEFVGSRLKEGVSRGTTNRQRACLSRVLQCAVDWGYLESNVVRRIKPFKEAPPRIRYLSIEESHRLIAAMADDLRPILIAALTTGARRGELLGLDWADVDLEHRLMVFRRTKNGDSRTVPIGSALLAALMGLPNRIGRVFPVSIPRLRSQFDAALRRAGISSYRWHDNRHTAASRLVQAGVPLPVIQRLGGWRSYTMVLRYAHVSDAQVRDAVAVLDGAAVWSGAEKP